MAGEEKPQHLLDLQYVYSELPVQNDIQAYYEQSKRENMGEFLRHVRAAEKDFAEEQKRRAYVCSRCRRAEAKARARGVKPCFNCRGLDGAHNSICGHKPPGVPPCPCDNCWRPATAGGYGQLFNAPRYPFCPRCQAIGDGLVPMREADEPNGAARHDVDTVRPKVAGQTSPSPALADSGARSVPTPSPTNREAQAVPVRRVTVGGEVWESIPLAPW
jgi:hypothetical protein